MAEVLVVGPASWNHIVDLDTLPEPRPHMTFARGDYSTVGGTSAGKALHLVDLGRDVELATVLGTDNAGHRVESALRAAGIPLLLERTGPTERHLNLMAPDGGRVSVYLSVPDEPAPGALDAVVTAMSGARALVLDLAPRAARLRGGQVCRSGPTCTTTTASPSSTLRSSQRPTTCSATPTASPTRSSSCAASSHTGPRLRSARSARTARSRSTPTASCASRPSPWAPSSTSTVRATDSSRVSSPRRSTARV